LFSPPASGFSLRATTRQVAGGTEFTEVLFIIDLPVLASRLGGGDNGKSKPSCLRQLGFHMPEGLSGFSRSVSPDREKEKNSLCSP